MTPSERGEALERMRRKISEALLDGPLSEARSEALTLVDRLYDAALTSPTVETGEGAIEGWARRGNASGVWRVVEDDGLGPSDGFARCTLIIHASAPRPTAAQEKP